MTEPYLIAHLVRGEPAFDIAIRMDGPDEDGDEWWIIPTSGHRAYPYWSRTLSCIGVDLLPDGNWAWGRTPEYTYEGLVDIPAEGWPDHYPHSASPTPCTTPDLRSLGLSRPQPKIARRI